MPTKLSVIIVAFICLIPNSSGFAQEEENEAGMESAFEALLLATQDENVEVRVNALYALELFESSSEVLIKRIQEALHDQDENVRAAAKGVLIRQDWDHKIKGQLLFEMLASSNPQIAIEALDEFTESYQTAYIDQILETLRSSETNPQTRSILISVIATNHKDLPKILPALEDIYTEAGTDAKLEILGLIGQYGDNATPALQFLAEQMETADANIKIAISGSIRQILESIRKREEAMDSIEQTTTAYLNRYDQNGDKKLDPSEAARITRSLGNSDTNQDGFITRNELRQSLEKQIRSSTRSTKNRDRRRDRYGVGDRE